MKLSHVFAASLALMSSVAFAQTIEGPNAEALMKAFEAVKVKMTAVEGQHVAGAGQFINVTANCLELGGIAPGKNYNCEISQELPVSELSSALRPVSYASDEKQAKAIVAALEKAEIASSREGEQVRFSSPTSDAPKLINMSTLLPMLALLMNSFD